MAAPVPIALVISKDQSNVWFAPLPRIPSPLHHSRQRCPMGEKKKTAYCKERERDNAIHRFLMGEEVRITNPRTVKGRFKETKGQECGNPIE